MTRFKIITVLMTVMLVIGVLTGCTNKDSNGSGTDTQVNHENNNNKENKKFNVVSTIFPQYDWVRQSGGVLCLGYFFGRTKPSTPGDPKSVNTLNLANELQQSFRENHKGVLCCHVHTKGMDMASGEHKAQCVLFTGEMAAKTAEIIARELNILNIDD